MKILNLDIKLRDHEVF